ncbi:MAG: hypothetical protein ACK5O9_06860 [Holosporales bacterium]|jgi:uncharacterized membrane protein (DUF4010 family)
MGQNDDIIPIACGIGIVALPFIFWNGLQGNWFGLAAVVFLYSIPPSMLVIAEHHEKTHKKKEINPESLTVASIAALGFGAVWTVGAGLFVAPEFITVSAVCLASSAGLAGWAVWARLAQNKDHPR